MRLALAAGCILAGATLPLVASCGQPRSPGSLVAQASDGGHGPFDAAQESDPDASDSAPLPLPSAPSLEIASLTGMVGEPVQELLVSGTATVSIPMPADGCIRIAFSSGAPVDAAVGRHEVRARSVGLIAERGPICERQGHALKLVFQGTANVRYQVLRAP